MPTIKEVLVVLPIPAEEHHKKLLRQAAPGIGFVYETLETVTPGHMKTVDVVFGNIKRAHLAAAKNLRWVQLTSAGADPYIQPRALPQGVLLTNATGVYGPAISEHMLGVLLTLMKNLHHYRDNQNAAAWQNAGRFSMLEGAVVLALGMGDIGGSFARKAKALGATTIGVRRANPDKPEYVDELYLLEQLDTVLPRVDVVAMSLPGNPQTCHLMDARRLQSLKKGAYLINVGRGNALDTEALVALLESGHLGGAALDVTDPEPLPKDHPLWSCKNAIITPHSSGGYTQTETVDRIVALFVDNLKRYLNDLPLQNMVDLETGYRFSSKPLPSL